MSARIVVLDGFALNPGDIGWDALAQLGEVVVHDRTAAGDIVARADGADIILTNKTPLTADTLDRLGRLKYIGVLATGYNVVDLAAARRRGIPVTNIPTYGTDSVAQLVFALLLELCHHVGLHDQQVRAGQWSAAKDFCFWSTPLIELAGKTMGVVGFGRIGRRVAELAQAFGMNVLACDVSRAAAPSNLRFEWRELDDLFAQSDVVSLHAPQTPDNAGFVNARLLGQMKPSAMLINTARGGLVNEADLADALNAGRLAAAAVDVVSAEPIAPNNPLLRARNCVITPHIAWATLSARQRLMAAAVQNVAAFLAGRAENVVNGPL